MTRTIITAFFLIYPWGHIHHSTTKFRSQERSDRRMQLRITHHHMMLIMAIRSLSLSQVCHLGVRNSFSCIYTWTRCSVRVSRSKARLKKIWPNIMTPQIDSTGWKREQRPMSLSSAFQVEIQRKDVIVEQKDRKFLYSICLYWRYYIQAHDLYQELDLCHHCLDDSVLSE